MIRKTSNVCTFIFRRVKTHAHRHRHRSTCTKPFTLITILLPWQRAKTYGLISFDLSSFSRELSYVWQHVLYRAHTHILWLDCGGAFLTRPSDRRPSGKINPEPPDYCQCVSSKSVFLFPFPDIKFGFVFVCMSLSSLCFICWLSCCVIEQINSVAIGPLGEVTNSQHCRFSGTLFIENLLTLTTSGT